jgi:hypothetical protein
VTDEKKKDALAEYRRKVAAGEIEAPQRSANPLERAQKRPTSLKMAIAARCWQCQGEGEDVGWREAIKRCTVPSCALHPHRPYQVKDGGSDDEE